MNVYLFYKTDPWHSFESFESTYITDDIEDGIAQCMAYKGMTEKQAEQIRECCQSQCNDTDNEWQIMEYQLKTFIDE